jgi:hypothetical protein
MNYTPTGILCWWKLSFLSVSSKHEYTGNNLVCVCMPMYACVCFRSCALFECCAKCVFSRAHVSIFTYTQYTRKWFDAAYHQHLSQHNIPLQGSCSLSAIYLDLVQRDHSYVHVCLEGTKKHTYTKGTSSTHWQTFLSRAAIWAWGKTRRGTHTTRWCNPKLKTHACKRATRSRQEPVEGTCTKDARRAGYAALATTTHVEDWSKRWCLGTRRRSRARKSLAPYVACISLGFGSRAAKWFCLSTSGVGLDACVWKVEAADPVKKPCDIQNKYTCMRVSQFYAKRCICDTQSRQHHLNTHTHTQHTRSQAYSHGTWFASQSGRW